MNRMLIVKVGSTLPEIAAERGDFESWFTDAMALAPSDVSVASVAAGEQLPDPREVRGVVVTGSSAMVTARAPWSEATGTWLRGCVELGTPLLGVCYGHQLLAHALGGTVAKNPRGREIGTISVTMTRAAAEDALFGVLPSVLEVQATHVESVIALPPGAELLGASPLDPMQVYRVGARAWCVQFHPEMNADIIRGYIAGRAEAIAAEGLDPASLSRAARDSAHGRLLLRRFAELTA